MTLESILPYLLPPVIGALIGYVTNYVAIRMLFRPLRAWHILGLRVPMTPGIIPAKRGELAARMGEMVGRHLLTPDDIMRTLEQEPFRRELRSAVAEKLGHFLDRELGAIATLVPVEYRHRFSELIDVAGRKLSTLILDYLHSEEFARQLSGYVRQRGEALMAMDLEQCLTPDRYDAARNHVDSLLTGYLNSDALAESVGNFVDSRTARWLRSDRPLRQLLPEELVSILLEQLDKELPPLLEKLGGLLYDPDFRQRLTVRIRQGIEAFLDSLGGLAGLLSGFVDLDKIYAKIPDTLDQLSEEVARWLKEEKTREQIARLLRERLEGFLDRPLAEYVEKMPYEKVDGVRCFLRERAVGIVQSRKTADALINLADRGVQSISNRSFGNLLDKAVPDGGAMRMIDLVTGNLLEAVRDDRVGAAIGVAVSSQLRALVYDRPLGKLAARLPADVSEELQDLFEAQLHEVLIREVPVLVDTLNVRQMVEDKVNSLDLLEVEGLLLGVMQEQFRYINLFGALLGFVIGMLNLLLLQFGYY